MTDITPITGDTSPYQPPPYEVDFEEFAHYLDGKNMSEAEKVACLQDYWTIIWGFVRLGYGLSPAQQIPCEQVGYSGDNAPKSRSDPLYSTSTIITKFVEAADAKTAPALEERAEL